jgi:hypothetical protein
MNPKLLAQIITACGLIGLVRAAHAQDWKLTSAPAGSWASVASSADATILYAVDGGSKSPLPIYWSQDSGKTWQTNPAPAGLWHKVCCSADGTIVGLSGAQVVCISTNSGTSWISNSTPTPALLACSADGLRWVAVAGSQVHTSTNSGVTWETNSIPDERWSALAASSDGLKLALAGQGYYWNGPIYVSTNAGSTWTPTAAPSLYWTSVACSADGAKLVAVVARNGFGSGAIYTSTNFGSQWTQTPAPSAIWSAVASSADGNRLLAAATYDDSAQVRLPLYISTNSGATWNWAASPTQIWLTVASSADATKMVAAATAGGIYTWRAAPSVHLSVVNTNLLLSWPSNSASAGFVLQQSLDLTATNWADVPVPSTLSNEEYQSTLPAPSGVAFYRLVLR